MMKILSTEERGISDLLAEQSRYADLGEEVEEVLAGWVEESYQSIIDKTEFLDSSRVKRID